MKSYFAGLIALLGIAIVWTINPFAVSAQEQESQPTGQQADLKALQEKIERLTAEVQSLRKQNEQTVQEQRLAPANAGTVPNQSQSVLRPSTIQTQTLPTPTLAPPINTDPIIAVGPVTETVVQPQLVQPQLVQPQVVQPQLAQPAYIQPQVAPVLVQPQFIQPAVQPFCNQGFSSRAVYVGPGGWGFDVGGLQFNFPRSYGHYHQNFRGHHHHRGGRGRERDDD